MTIQVVESQEPPVVTTTTEPNQAANQVEEEDGLDEFSENGRATAATLEAEEGDEAALAAAKKRSRIKKIAVALVLIGLIIFIIVDSTSNRYVVTGIQQFLKWIEENAVAGLFAFMGVYFIATILFIPGSLLTLGSGFVFANAFGLGWGVLLATIAVFIGATAGAIVAFLLGRYLLRDWVDRFSHKYPKMLAIDKALETRGFRIMVLLRLSPIIPFNAINYIAGITGISFSAYAWASFAILPGTVMFVFLGSTAGSLADSGASGDNSVVTIVSIVVGIAFGVLAIVAVSVYAKKELNKILAEQEEVLDSTEASVAVDRGTEEHEEENVNQSTLEGDAATTSANLLPPETDLEGGNSE